MQFLIDELGTINIIISSIITYIFVLKYGRKKSDFYVTFFALFYLTCLHLYRLIYFYGRLDIRDLTSIYMLTVCKFILLLLNDRNNNSNNKRRERRIWGQKRNLRNRNNNSNNQRNKFRRNSFGRRNRNRRRFYN